jgi:hypothetical protein
VVVQLLPGDVIALRLYGQRDSSAVTIKIQDLYFELVDRKVRRDKADRLKARKAKRQQNRKTK